MQLSEEHLDILTEILNIGVGKAANTLNQMLGTPIKLNIPKISIANMSEIRNLISSGEEDLLSSVNLTFRGDFAGSCKLIFTTEGASKLVSIFTEEEEDSDDINEIRRGTLSEIGNVVLNSLMGTISNVLTQRFIYTPPKYIEGNIGKLINYDKFLHESYMLIASTTFSIESSQIKGDFVLIFETGSLDILMSKIDIINQKGTF